MWPKADPAARPTRCRTGQHRGAVRSLRRSAVPRGTTRRSREAAGEHDAHPYRRSTFGGGEEPPARHRVGPWIPVTPVDLVPSLAGGDIHRRARALGRRGLLHRPRRGRYGDLHRAGVHEPRRRGSSTYAYAFGSHASSTYAYAYAPASTPPVPSGRHFPSTPAQTRIPVVSLRPHPLQTTTNRGFSPTSWNAAAD
jgi:hypothetical protein